MEVAVLNLTFGKPTNGPMPTQPILAVLLVTIVVQEMNVEMVHRDKMGYVIKMDVI